MDPKSKPKPEKLRKGDQTKQNIVDAAIRLFSKHGFSETSFQMIADECEIGQSIPLYHFKTKAGLLEAAVERCQEQSWATMTETFESSDHAYARLKKICLGTFNWSNVYRSQAELSLLHAYFAAVHVSMVPEFQASVMRLRKEIEATIMAGQREGIFEFSGDPSLLAESIHEMLLGLCITFLAGRNLSKFRDFEKKIDQALQLMVKYKI